MVARIKPHATHTRILQYNERKVAQQKARLLEAKNFLQDPRRLTWSEKSQRFQRQNDLNTRAQDKMLHITLNFVPGEIISDEKMKTIANRYMEGLRMENQPFLVYRHTDAGHPHAHIVTSLIRTDGTRIKTNQMGRRLSSPTRKAIEKDFGLIPAQKKQHRKQHQGPLQKVVYGPDTPLLEQMERALQAVHRDYRFTSLPEYNAILRTANLLADPGGPDSQTRQYGGLHYVALDDNGQRVGIPVKASDLAGPYTLNALEEAYARNKAPQQKAIPAIQQRVDWSLLQNPYTLRGLVLDLQQEGIDLVIYQNADHRVYGLTYVDHNHKTAVTGSDLGKPYTAASILKSLETQQHPGPQPSQYPRPPQQGNRPGNNAPPGPAPGAASFSNGASPSSASPEDPGPVLPELPGFARAIPQILGHLMQSDPSLGSNPQELQQDQQQRKRKRL